MIALIVKFSSQIDQSIAMISGPSYPSCNVCLTVSPLTVCFHLLSVSEHIRLFTAALPNFVYDLAVVAQ